MFRAPKYNLQLFSSISLSTDFAMTTSLFFQITFLHFCDVSALQVDFYRHSFDNIRVVDNVADGLGVVYSDIYSGASNIVRNSEFSNNRGSGIAFKQLGLKITGLHNHFDISYLTQLFWSFLL